MSTETETPAIQPPIIPIRYWEYPDDIAKMVMNTLIEKGYMSALEYIKPSIDADISSVITFILNNFEDNDYVYSEFLPVSEDSDDTYKIYRISPFFTAMMEEYNELGEQARQQSREEWEAKQAELPPEERLET